MEPKEPWDIQEEDLTINNRSGDEVEVDFQSLALADILSVNDLFVWKGRLYRVYELWDDGARAVDVALERRKNRAIARRGHTPPLYD